MIKDALIPAFSTALLVRAESFRSFKVLGMAVQKNKT
jgi:hypothetical protein